MTDTENRPGNKRDRLAGFHHTISEQLNARLSESPRFFWALVVVSTGYGYVLWNVATNQRQTEPGLCAMLLTAALLSCVAVLWASWYLAALGYAFRYLQNVQHSIERDLGWAAYGPTRGKPPARIRWSNDVFWLLPSIYHAHVFGLVLFLAIIISTCAFYWYSRQCWGSSSALCIGIISLVSWVIGVAIIIVINVLYVLKFKRKKPASVTVLDD